MHEGAYFERLFATALVAAVLIGVVVKPNAPRTYAEQASRFAPAPTSLAERPCRVAGPLLTNGFADLNDVLSVSPLGGVTAPGEPLPAPFVRVNTRKGETMFERRTTSALAPARADVIAVERRLQRDADGAATGQSWTVRLAVCENVRLYYDDLDSIDPDLMRRIGGVAALRPVDGSDHLAATTQVRVKPGEPLGAGDGFDVGLEDRGAPPADLVRPERYRANPYVAARVLGAPPALLKAIAVDHTRAQSPLDYLPPRIATSSKASLGDAHPLLRNQDRLHKHIQLP